MNSQSQAATRILATLRTSFWLHLALILGLSVAYELAFIPYGLNYLDESWPLHAAMGLEAGGTLYREVFWVFPPAHLWMASLAYHFDPPGILLARQLYALWNVALCGAMLVLGRRLMTPGFALLGCVLLAIAAPRTHLMQALYGYRYLVLTVFALLCFHRRLRGGGLQWMGLAGVLVGIAVVFRLTPAFAVSCGIALAVAAASRDWRRWLQEWSAYGVGILIPLLPVLLYFHLSVGIATFVQEVVIHPLEMLQPMPWPDIVVPEEWTRKNTRLWFVALQFRLYWLLYAAYAVAVAVGWLRAALRREPYAHPLLLAVVVWGGVFFIRSLGRSDEPHLDSVIPPICLLLAHALCLGFRQRREASPPAPRRLAAAFATGIALLAAWIYLLEIDVMLRYESKGGYPVQIRGRTFQIASATRAKTFNGLFRNIEKQTRPGDVLLDLGAAPIFHVATDRMGPGYRDVVMPGTFLDEEEERAFLALLEARPPAAVVWSPYAFDRMPERSVKVTAPLVSQWVLERYEQVGPSRSWVLLLPR